MKKVMWLVVMVICVVLMISGNVWGLTNAELWNLWVKNKDITAIDQLKIVANDVTKSNKERAEASYYVGVGSWETSKPSLEIYNWFKLAHSLVPNDGEFWQAKVLWGLRIDSEIQAMLAEIDSEKARMEAEGILSRRHFARVLEHKINYLKRINSPDLLAVCDDVVNNYRKDNVEVFNQVVRIWSELKLKESKGDKVLLKNLISLLSDFVSALVGQTTPTDMQIKEVCIQLREDICMTYFGVSYRDYVKSN